MAIKEFENKSNGMSTQLDMQLMFVVCIYLT